TMVRDDAADVSDIAFLSMMLGTAAAAGVLGAILGLGGGILLVPVLTLFFGVSLPYAMGASIVSVIATSCGAAAGHLSSGLANLRLGLFLATATVSGALLGAGLVGVVPARALQILFGLALGYSAFTTLRHPPGDRDAGRAGRAARLVRGHAAHRTAAQHDGAQAVPADRPLPRRLDAAPRSWAAPMRRAGATSRRATASPGRVRASAGGVRGGRSPLRLNNQGGHIGAPHFNR